MRHATKTYFHPALCAFAASLALSVAGCSDDPAGYYLAGRLVDGATGAIVSSAQINLLTGDASRPGEVRDNGDWVAGPIAPGTSYQLVVDAAGRRGLVFTGQPLPAFDGDEDRTVIRDLYVYDAGKDVPETTLRVVDINTGSALPGDGLVTLAPTAAGLDPAFEVGFDDVSAGLVISGVSRQPQSSTLPNDLDARLPSQSFPIVDGAAVIPAGALTFGVTYAARLDMTGRGAGLSLAFTALDSDEIVVGLSSDATPAPAAASGGTERFFSGRVYDGVSLARIEDYSIRLEYHDTVLSGAVDRTGRYVMGPLTPNADYSVVIEAGGYRSFLSHNPRLGGAQPDFLSLYYDAFLFPSSMPAPQASLRILRSDGEPARAGFVRLSPRGTSSLFDGADETPAGVNRQIWSNDEDLQQRAVALAIAEGAAQIAEGDLVLGVSYQVTVYGVPDHSLVDVGTFRAGQDGDQTYILAETASAPLQVVSDSTRAGLPTPSGQLTIRFDRPIQLDPLIARDSMLRSLNQSFSITSTDRDADGEYNRLRSFDGTPGYRGVALAVAEDTLTLTWNPAAGLETSDVDDPVQRITYGGLGSVSVRPTGGDAASSRSLSSLLSRSAITVTLDPS